MNLSGTCPVSKVHINCDLFIYPVQSTQGVQNVVVVVVVVHVVVVVVVARHTCSS